MSFFEKIALCNKVDYSRFRPFLLGDTRIGWVPDDFIDAIEPYTDIFHISDEKVTLNPEISDFEARTQVIEHVVQSIVKTGRIPLYYGEIYPASTDHRDKPFFLIDRAAASYFGTRTYGQHLNGFVRKGDEILMWVGRRAKDKGFWPGKLDQIVAGGLPYRVSLQENLIKECYEEAGIPAELVAQALSVGCVTCTYENERGIKPETLYCYDLELPEDFQPVCQDGEVDEFMLLPLEEVMKLVRDTDEFKLNCNLVAIDFLIRHGQIKPEEADYELLVSGLRQ